MGFPKLIIPFYIILQVFNGICFVERNFYMGKDNRPTKDGKIWFYRLNMKILMVLIKLRNQVDMQLKRKQKMLGLNLN